MKIAKMSFKNHFWTYNPSTVKLLSNREIVEQKFLWAITLFKTLEETVE